MSTDLGTTGVATWQDHAWRSAALAWATERLAERGLEVAGEPEQPHVRAWSTAFRLPVRGGAVWLKSVGPGSAQEPALVEALGDWAPEHVLVPLAVQAERRLMLLPDGGTTLRATGRASSIEAWEALLQDYARLQVELSSRPDEMVGLGVPDLRPGRMPDLAAELLADDSWLMVDRPGGLTSGQRSRLVGELDDYRRLCTRLADGGIPASLQHDDLHDANVFVGDGGHRFFDWGDASVAHPFLSLLVPLRVAARALDVPAGDAVLHRLRDAYLDAWSGYGDLAELRVQADVALRVAPLPRAMTWERILRGVHPDERAEWLDAVPGWTAEYLEPGSLTGRAAGRAAPPGQ
jgi:hypothetical protein